MPEQVMTATVAEHALGQALDLTALEHRERELIHRPETPEIDSFVEAYVLMGHLIVQFAHVNGVQLDLARDLAGWGDRLVTAMRDGEHNRAAAPLTGRALAARLRPHLDTLADADRGAAWPQATGLVHDVFAAVPADVIFQHSVTRQLGAEKTAALMRLHDRWRKHRAADTAETGR